MKKNVKMEIVCDDNAENVKDHVNDLLSEGWEILSATAAGGTPHMGPFFVVFLVLDQTPWEQLAAKTKNRLRRQRKR